MRVVRRTRPTTTVPRTLEGYTEGLRVVVITVTPPKVNQWTPQFGVEVLQNETPSWLVSASVPWDARSPVFVGQTGRLFAAGADSGTLHRFVPDAGIVKRIARRR